MSSSRSAADSPGPASILGCTLGDANGIGPEVALKASTVQAAPDACRVLIGSRKALAPFPDAASIPEWSPDHGEAPSAPVSLWDPEPDLPLDVKLGTVQEDAARCAAAWIRHAAQACMDGRISGMVTAPVNKEGLKRAGVDFPGHTELLAEVTGVKRFGMLLKGGPLNVILATRHVPVRRVAEELTRESILTAIELTHEAAPWLKLPDTPIAVCGLNPHAGDGGTIGTEEQDLIQPVIEETRTRGWNVEGPYPSDTVFHFAVRGKFSAVVCMYHDQGLSPLKMLAFDEGVNITLGLPIIRTSPDHGTAYNIAGRRLARPNSMLTALRAAADLCTRPNPWARG